MERATVIRRQGGSTLVNGYLQYNLTQIYQVFAPRDSSIIAILNWPGVPRAGQRLILGGAVVWVGRPTFQHPDRDKGRFEVTVPISNQTSNFERDENGNPVSDPTQVAKRVLVTWREETEQVDNATLRTITKGAPEQEGGTSIAIPGWLAGNTAGPVRNSAGVPRKITRTRRLKNISVEGVFNDWSSTWDDFQNAINSDEVTITVRDSRGVRATHTFAPLTLKMTVSAPPEWKDSRLYFRTAFNMVHRPETWVHAELDAGQKRRLFVDQYKPEGGKYTQEDLDELEIDGDYGYGSILTDKKTVAIGEPVPFNGTGAEQPLARTAAGTYSEGEPIYLNYDIETNIRAFGPLNL